MTIAPDLVSQATTHLPDDGETTPRRPAKKFVVAATALFTLAVSGAAWAAAYQEDQTVESVQCNEDGSCFVQTSSAHRPPACGENNRRFAWDGATDAGKSMTNLFMSAQLSGKRVHVWYSTGGCYKVQNGGYNYTRAAGVRLF